MRKLENGLQMTRSRLCVLSSMRLLRSSLLLLLLPILAVQECIRVRGRVGCATDKHRIQRIQVLLYDRDVLPWEMDDLMGETVTDDEGAFVVTGCGDDLGWWNLPDPYLKIPHRCPVDGHNVAITLRYTICELERNFLPNETVLEETIQLDKQQIVQSYTAFASI